MTCKQSPDANATTGNTTASTATRPCDPSGTAPPDPAVRRKRTAHASTAPPSRQSRPCSCPFISFLHGKADGDDDRDANFDCEGSDRAAAATVAAAEARSSPATFALRLLRLVRLAEAVLPPLAGLVGTPPAMSPGLPTVSVARCCRCRLDSVGGGATGGGGGGDGDSDDVCGDATIVATNVDNGFARAAAAAIAAARPTRYILSSTRINRSFI